MVKIKQKKKKLSTRSRAPFVRRDEVEMSKIVSDIQSGIISIRGACFKYGLCRNTLKLWITRINMSNLVSDMAKNPKQDLVTDINSIALQRKVYELTRALEDAKLKINSLETLIKVSEEDFKIKIRKKSGTKQSKE